MPGTVPFAVDFDAAGHLVVTEAGTNALATFTIAADGTLAPIDEQPTGQAATCWIVQANGTSTRRTRAARQRVRSSPHGHADRGRLGPPRPTPAPSTPP